MGGEDKILGHGVLIERFDQVMRREENRWVVVTTDQVLQDFLIESGDYTIIARQPDSVRTVAAGNPSSRKSVL